MPTAVELLRVGPQVRILLGALVEVRAGLSGEQRVAGVYAGTANLLADGAMVMMGGMPVALLGAAGARAYAGLQQTLDEGTVGVGRSRQDSRRDVTPHPAHVTHIATQVLRSPTPSSTRSRPRTTCTTGDSPGTRRWQLPPPRPRVGRRPARRPTSLWSRSRSYLLEVGWAHYEADPRMAWTLNPSFPGTLTAPLFPPSKSPEAIRWPVANS